MARVEYYNDPNAPKATSLVPAVTAAIRDSDDRILLVQPTDDGPWVLPGGVMVAGEAIADAAIRTVAEETGIQVEITGLVGIYTSPHHVTADEDGTVRQELSVCFHARPGSGQLSEAATVRWLDIAELDGLPIHPSSRTRINDALGDRARPRIA
ncbi:MAG TPA: NUDIX domain-containing protein [Pseudonocardia sp.]|nr:NUDIX domain-containing protein [Pseudonocardia sp.]